MTQPETLSSHAPSIWPEYVTIVEVTPRDGLQDAATVVSTDDKIHFIEALIAAGAHHIEATSFMRPTWIPQLADADDLGQRLPRQAQVSYSALVPNLRGYERARAAGMDEVVLVVSASESHNRANLNRPVAQTLVQLRDVASAAKADGVRIRGAIATAFGCAFEGSVSPEAVLRIVDAYLEMGVDSITLSDTIGGGQPRQVSDLFHRVRIHVPTSIPLGGHFHNRAGIGLINVFAAVQAGAVTFDGAVGGLGGCPYAPGAPGNLATSDLVRLLDCMGYETGLSLAGLAHAETIITNALAHGKPVASSHSIRAAVPSA